MNSRQKRPFLLYEAALDYRQWGWSVLPLWGDQNPARPKAPALMWREFQQRQATETELKSWFVEQACGGLGIICGAISGLVVLDFDTQACADAFARYCPELLNTFTVHSGNRKLPHYYYRVPEGMHVASRHLADVDLQAEGTYVVAPPTRINGCEWSVVEEHAPLLLDAANLKRIYAFLDLYEHSGSSTTEALELVDVSRRQVSGPVLQRWYQRQAPQIGRNNALFRVASLARDSGWLPQDAVRLLLGLHIAQPANNGHPAETAAQRRCEGLRTIRSAFRYVRRAHSRRTAIVTGLPNSLREKLLQSGEAAVARVLDGLLMAGIKAGRVLTERVICEMVRAYGIGRRAVQSALKAFESPRNPPKPPANAAKELNQSETPCTFVRGAKRVKMVGRRPCHYRMPGNGALYRAYKVRPSGSDVLRPADLRTAASYRQALQRSLYERRPGTYSRQWLAGRLGVSKWTSRRYDQRIGALVDATYHNQVVSWGNVDKLGLKQRVCACEGIYLETAEGKRYPPLYGLAKRLLEQAHGLVLKRQHWNYYRLDTGPFPGEVSTIGKSSCEIIHEESGAIERKFYYTLKAPVAAGVEQAADGVQAEVQEKRRFWLCRACLHSCLSETSPGNCATCGADQWESIPAALWQDTAQLKSWWKLRCAIHAQEKGPRLAQSPVQDEKQNALIERLYAQVGKRDAAHGLSRGSARRLVQTYGAEAIEKALVLLRSRRNVRSAAGFVIAVLRSEKQGIGAQQQRPDDAESHAAWLKRLKESPYIDYYENLRESG